jgi:EAL domain-containing protein (putative c-di-GMP-specific phosphodiesterase class I)
MGSARKPKRRSVVGQPPEDLESRPKSHAPGPAGRSVKAPALGAEHTLEVVGSGTEETSGEETSGPVALDGSVEIFEPEPEETLDAVAKQAEETLEVVDLDMGEALDVVGLDTEETLDNVELAPLSQSADELRLAEARRRVEELPAEGSIHVVFQPIVDLATTKVIGYEALARFPGDKSVSPRTWFAEAAEVGLLLEIEMTAIRAALAKLERLPSDAFISVNVSPATAGSDELRDVLGSVDPKRVVLEITENAAAGDYEEVSEAVGELRANGVRIAIDDTGSGSVSFNSLFDVHADIIKIDIDVTHGIASDPMKEAMASALKGLADRLGAMSLAEGIETEEELNLLRGVGVQAGQGYLFGRPEPVPD